MPVTNFSLKRKDIFQSTSQIPGLTPMKESPLEGKRDQLPPCSVSVPGFTWGRAGWVSPSSLLSERWTREVLSILSWLSNGGFTTFYPWKCQSSFSALKVIWIFCSLEKHKCIWRCMGSLMWTSLVQSSWKNYAFTRFTGAASGSLRLALD